MRLYAYSLMLMATLIGSAQSVPLSQRPKLFFYPPIYRTMDGRPLNSPQTVSVDQITTDFPQIPDMAGVVLMVYWSTLCPSSDGCDLSLIDRTLSYWRDRGKSVILDVATIGYPILNSENGKLRVVGATPDWVLNRIRTYSYPARVLGAPAGSGEQATTFPDFRDKAFLALVSDLILKLAKYDGDSAIFNIRISAGLMGEDNPRIGPVGSPIRGYSEQSWLDYCQRVTQVFRQTFSKTRLEFDIGRLSWMYARSDEGGKRLVQRFLDTLFEAHAVLAFDGLDSDSMRYLRESAITDNGVSASLHLIKAYRQKGGDVGLEAVGLLSAPRMRDVSAMAQAIREISPTQIVFFFDFPQAIRSLICETPCKTGAPASVARDSSVFLFGALGYPGHDTER
jgi:hypothetical protein